MNRSALSLRNRYRNHVFTEADRSAVEGHTGWRILQHAMRRPLATTRDLSPKQIPTIHDHVGESLARSTNIRLIDRRKRCLNCCPIRFAGAGPPKENKQPWVPTKVGVNFDGLLHISVVREGATRRPHGALDFAYVGLPWFSSCRIQKTPRVFSCLAPRIWSGYIPSVVAV